MPVDNIGKVKLKEKGYLPTQDCLIKSATVSQKADRWFVSLLVEQAPIKTVGKVSLPEWDMLPFTEGVGIDLGLKELAVMSNGMRVSNIN